MIALCVTLSPRTGADASPVWRPPAQVGGRRMMVERPLYNETTGKFMHFAAGWCDKNSWLSQHRGR